MQIYAKSPHDCQRESENGEEREKDGVRRRGGEIESNAPSLMIMMFS